MKKQKQLLFARSIFLFIIIIAFGIIVFSEKAGGLLIPKAQEKINNYIDNKYKNEKDNFKLGKIKYKNTTYTMKVTNKENKKLGDYLSLTAVDIDKEKYSYDKSLDIIYWNIGDMKSYETQKCNILLEAENVGHNTIYLCGFDYLHEDSETTIETELSLDTSAFTDIEEEEDRYIINDAYYVGDLINLKAVLNAVGTNQNLYGKIYFYNNNLVHSQSEISNVNDDYYAVTHVKLSPNMSLTAQYDGAQILSTTYLPSQTKSLIFNNIQKYNTLQLPHFLLKNFLYMLVVLSLDSHNFYILHIKTSISNTESKL